MPEPTTVTKLQSFLGMINYYRKFKDFARLAIPLYELTKTNTVFKWEERHQEDFNN